MFSFFQKRLTEMSQHYIDWSRIGVLIQSGTHHYTAEEIMTRGIVIASTAVGAFLGYYFNNEDKTHRSDLTIAVASGVLGFALSHAVVIYPLVKKRMEMNAECNRLKQEIKNYARAAQPLPLQNKIDETIAAILHVSLTDDKAGRASQTWGRRKRLLESLLAALRSGVSEEFLQRDAKDIMNYLDISSNNVHNNRLSYK